MILRQSDVPPGAAHLICRNMLPANIANGGLNIAEGSLAVSPSSGTVRLLLFLRAASSLLVSSMPKCPKAIWYVSFDDFTSRRRVRSVQAFKSESEAKQFAREALASGKAVYAGTINPHEPRRLIPPEQIDEWLKEHRD
jgi:hypothetical protein